MRAAEFLARAGGMPIVTLPALTDGRSIVVVAPHPDDESLGCGGLIAEAGRIGISVRLVVVSDGAGSHPNSPSYPPDRLRELRERETLAATGHLGLDPQHITFLRLPDRAVPRSGPAATRAADTIAGIARDCDAGAVFATWRHDPHCDHEASAEIAASACGRLPGIRCHAYPVWGWTLPADREVDSVARGVRLDVSRHLDAKGRAIAAHLSQTTALIADDPTGFRLTPAMLAHFAGPFETFLET